MDSKLTRRQRLANAIRTSSDAHVFGLLVVGAVLVIAAFAVLGLAIHAFLWSSGFRSW